MSTWQIVLLVILAVLIAAVVALYFLGRKAQKKQAQQQQQIDAMKQTVSMLIIDKKRMKIKDSGLPQAVVSGIYITDVKGLRGKVQVEQKKKGFFRRTLEKVQEKAGAKPLK